MVKSNASYPDFSSGEISPRLYGRFDLSAYYAGGRRVENFVPQLVGPTHFRTGFVFASPTRDNQEAVLWNFEFTDASSFALEITPNFIRFYENNGLVTDTAQGITGVTQASPAVATYSGDDNYTNGDRVIIESISGMVQLNNNEYEVANVDTAANTFELAGVDSTAFDAYVSGGSASKVVEVSTPYAAGDLKDIQFAQNGIDLYLVHPSHNPKKLEYINATTWLFSDHSPVKQILGTTQNITGITQANPARVTYSGSDSFTNGDTVRISEVSGMVEAEGDYVIANVDTGSNRFDLVGLDSSGFSAYVSGGKVTPLTETPAPFLSSGEYPSAITFYEQRLVYGGSTNKPQTLYFSKSGEVDNFTTGTEVDDGLVYVVSGNGNTIRWLRGTEKFLSIGTFGDVLKATGGIDDVITPTSISIKPTNSFGVDKINPIGKGSQVFYMQRNKLIMRSLEYNFTQDSYFPTDRNTIAEHITVGGVDQIAFQEGRPNIVWSIRSDGALLGLTIEDEESISGWHRHDTSGEFKSVTTVARPSAYDQLWVCVKRRINGVDKYYIEYQADDVDFERRHDFFGLSSSESGDSALYNNKMFEDQKKYIHVDSALSFYGDQAGLGANASLTPAATTGVGITFTAGASVFSAGDVGKQLWRKSITGAEEGVALITGYVSATEVTCTILEDFDSVSVIPAGEWFLTTMALSGLSHLEGKEVVVVADGGQHPNVIVSGGVIALQRQSTVVHVGLKYTGYLESNDVEAGGVNGPAQTKRKSLAALGFRFLDSLFAKFGTDYYKLDQLNERTASMKMNRPPLMFTGDRKQQYVNKSLDKNDAGWTREKRVIIVQDQPFPCKLQLLIPYMNTSNT